MVEMVLRKKHLKDSFNLYFHPEKFGYTNQAKRNTNMRYPLDLVNTLS